MSNKFNIRRFVLYAKMHYCANWRIYIGVSIAVLILIFTNCIKSSYLSHRLTTTGLKSATSVVSHELLGACFAGLMSMGIAFAIMSFRSLSGQLSIREMMTPVSNLERYIFALLNSTVVCFALTSILSTIAIDYAETLYYISSDNTSYIFSGPLYFSPDKAHIPEGYVQHDILNIFRSIAEGDTKFITSCYITMIAYANMVSVIMWGELTFKKWGGVISLLLHAVVILLAVHLVQEYAEYITEIFRVPYNGYMTIIDSNPVARIVGYLSIATILVYQWVTWKKLTTKQITD